MRSPPTHDLMEAREYRLRYQARACLAMVDLDSYRSYAREGADRLDMLQHLCREVQALTAVMWETPDRLLNLRLLLADDSRVGHELTLSGHHVFADGWVRTDGRLCLVGHDRLLDVASHRNRPLLSGKRPGDTRSPHLLLVPPGVYSVTVFSSMSQDAAAFDYAVVLRHYPHPAPRLYPVRLAGLAILGAGGGHLAPAPAPPDREDSHKAPR